MNAPPLRNGHGPGSGSIACVNEETSRTCWVSTEQTYQLRNDPLSFRATYFRVRNCVFPTAGVYNIEFRYNGVALAAQSLLVEGKRT